VLILFTRDSRKAFSAISAIVSAAVLYACIVIALQMFSTWAERDLHAFPFKQEDWLRYLVSSGFEANDRKTIMLTGPSTVRENFRYERFEAAFPNYHIFQGGISLGTLEDVTAALEYMEKVYGPSALPEILVLGISPRVVANIPDNRPFALGLNRYSPYFFAIQGASRIVLRYKSVLEGLLARTRFIAQKEPERFRTAFLAVANYWLWENDSAQSSESTLGRAMNWLFKTYPVDVFLRASGQWQKARGFHFTEIIRWLISPYKYSLNPPHRIPLIPREKFKPDPDSFWGAVYSWNPKKSEAETRARLRYFADLVKRHAIRTLVVNMPERNASRIIFYERNYDAYLDIVSDELNGIDFINLREFSETDEFYDLEHTTPAGSARLSDEIIRLMKMGRPLPYQTQGCSEPLRLCEPRYGRY